MFSRRQHQMDPPVHSVHSMEQTTRLYEGEIRDGGNAYNTIKPLRHTRHMQRIALPKPNRSRVPLSLR